MKCVYPGCRANLPDQEVEIPIVRDRVFCAIHVDVTCAYPHFAPLCRELVMPASSYCVEHNQIAGFFGFYHAYLHQQVAAAQARAREQEAIIKRAGTRFSNGH